jgi:hypothetical protein
MNLFTLPEMPELSVVASQVEPYMRPNTLPTAVVAEGYLSAEECGSIQQQMATISPYNFKKCNATTRQAPRPLPRVFDPLIQFTLGINNMFWDFNLDEEPAAWMQTYQEGNDYDLHSDGSLGQSRKLTAVLLLSPPKQYVGGELEISATPAKYRVPRTQGTVVVFPGWVLHRVLKVTAGQRRTINLGFWGPPFK